MPTKSPLTFPFNPLDGITPTPDDRRRSIAGILDSYNGTYDTLIEAVQNSVDAVEDACLLGLNPPYLVHVTVNLAKNWISVLDTGVGMTPEQAGKAFVPNKSFKADPLILGKRGVQAYRGYKGVGLTFLAYSTDEVVLHTKKDRILIKGRMKYGRAWATGGREDEPMVVEDKSASPLEKFARGTYVKVTFSPSTRPRSLNRTVADPNAWATILRTRTAIGQILLDCKELTKFDARLTVISAGGAVHESKIEPVFYYPHLAKRKPAFRFLDLMEYYQSHGEQTKPPAEKLRQDGLHVCWDTAKIRAELTNDQRTQLEAELQQYTPSLYAFVPYQGSVWGEMNAELVGRKDRSQLYPGLVIAVNRQRLADKFEIEATRNELFSRNVLIIVHFNNAKPDQGRKTVQDDVSELARRAADRAVQYLAKAKDLLRPAGEAPTPGQREVEKNHADWIFNVRTHATTSPLHVPPIRYASEPLTEQDVVGLFHQLSVAGVFPGIRVFATSQSATYDCLAEFDCPAETPGLQYKAVDQNPLGVSPYILGDKGRFSTSLQTIEFKNNLDALVADLGSGLTRKSYQHIDVCVCWSSVSQKFPGYELSEIKEPKIESRVLPGVTHLLEKDGDTHVMQVIMLKEVVRMMKAGGVPLLVAVAPK